MRTVGWSRRPLYVRSVSAWLARLYCRTWDRSTYVEALPANVGSRPLQDQFLFRHDLVVLVYCVWKKYALLCVGQNGRNMGTALVGVVQDYRDDLCRSHSQDFI